MYPPCSLSPPNAPVSAVTDVQMEADDGKFCMDNTLFNKDIVLLKIDKDTHILCCPYKTFRIGIFYKYFCATVSLGI